MAGGDSYGASLSFATSSGASQSGATSQKGGGNYGSQTGAGSLIVYDQSGSLGASTGGISWLPVVIGAAAVLGLWLLSRFISGKGGGT